MDKLTFEVFKNKINLKYTFGTRRTNGASRRYHDKDMNIGCETHTPYNENKEKWGKGETLYYIEDDERVFKTLKELFVAYSNK